GGRHEIEVSVSVEIDDDRLKAPLHARPEGENLRVGLRVGRSGHLGGGDERRRGSHEAGAAREQSRGCQKSEPPSPGAEHNPPRRWGAARREFWQVSWAATNETGAGSAPNPRSRTPARRATAARAE